MLREKCVCFCEYVKGASNIQRLHTFEYDNGDFHAVTLIDCKHVAIDTRPRRPVGGLPADYREVITLRHLEGLTFPEVARRMERSLASVEKLWVRALASLRRSFGEAP